MNSDPYRRSAFSPIAIDNVVLQNASFLQKNNLN